MDGFQMSTSGQKDNKWVEDNEVSGSNIYNNNNSYPVSRPN
jgi:hypothetical protein